jgi:hypothetical protein
MAMLTTKTLVASAIALTTAVGAATIATLAGAASDVPTKNNVALLDRAAPFAPDAPGRTPIARAQTTDPYADTKAQLRGVTVQQAGAAIDVSTDGSIVCVVPSIDGVKGAGVGCSPLPLSADGIPYQIGDNAQGSWVTAVAPDGVVSVSAVGSNGQTGEAKVSDNVAVVRIGGAREVKSVAWTLADGRTVTDQIDLSDPVNPKAR